MKHFIAILLVFSLVFLAQAALADSVQGSWSGSAKAAGHSFKASCTFNGSGGFSARAAGMSVSGSYSISGSSVTLSAKGTSITFKLTTDGNSQSMSGSGRYRGIKGSIYLSRTLSDAQVAASRTTPYAKWKNETDEASRALEIYKSGYIYYSEINAEEARGEAFESVKDGFESGSITDYFSLMTAMDLASTPDEYIARAEFADKTITATPLNGACPAWAEYEKDGKYVFEYDVKSGKLTFAGLTFDYASEIDSKPESALFRPYVTIERGDGGEAVKAAQQKLIDLKLLDGKADGEFGPITEKAVKAFEEANGFAPDGKLSGDEIEKLYELEAAQ